MSSNSIMKSINKFNSKYQNYNRNYSWISQLRCTKGKLPPTCLTKLKHLLSLYFAFSVSSLNYSSHFACFVHQL